MLKNSDLPAEALEKLVYDEMKFYQLNNIQFSAKNLSAHDQILLEEFEIEIKEFLNKCWDERDEILQPYVDELNKAYEDYKLAFEAQEEIIKQENYSSLEDDEYDVSEVNNKQFKEIGKVAEDFD